MAFICGRKLQPDNDTRLMYLTHGTEGTYMHVRPFSGNDKETQTIRIPDSAYGDTDNGLAKIWHQREEARFHRGQRIEEEIYG